MRLLQIGEDGTFRPVRHDGRTSDYAILSHTWGPDDDEVIYADLTRDSCPKETRDRCQKKTGCHRLVFCSKRAAKDNLGFFWVDTCCIRNVA